MRKRREEPPENHERWLVSYADFITLLFAFFVVMYATSTSNLEKQKEFESSVRLNLKLSSNESSGTPAHVPDAGAVIAEYIQGQDRSDSFPQKGSPAEAADFASRFLAKKVDKAAAKELGLEVHHDTVGVRVSLAASAFFQPGDFKLKRSALATLDQLAEFLAMTDKKIIVEGHTDNQPISSSTLRNNWELGSLRATSVVHYLIKYQNINPQRMAAISYADQKPIAPNDSESNRARNRRIEILIVTADK